jgi:hypothetical protein
MKGGKQVQDKDKGKARRMTIKETGKKGNSLPYEILGNPSSERTVWTGVWSGIIRTIKQKIRQQLYNES